MCFSPRISYLKEAVNLSLRKLPAQLKTLQEKKTGKKKTPHQKKTKTQQQKTPNPNNSKNNNNKKWKSLTLVERWEEWNREWGREKGNYLYE